MFDKWCEAHNRHCLDDAGKCDVYINVPFAQMDTGQFNYALPRFLCEAQTKNGNYYLPDTLRQIVISLQKFLEVGGRVEKFLSDAKYKTIQDTMDDLVIQRTEAGMACNKKQAKVITKDMEDIMWTTGVLGDKNPRQLVDTLLYLLGLHLALRGRDEHRSLRFQPSQITVKTSEDGRKFLEYRENVTKPDGRGLHSARQRQKVTVCCCY